MVGKDGDLLDELFDQRFIKLCDVGFLTGDEVLQLLDPVHGLFPVMAVYFGLWCCTIKVDIENSKGQYIEKDKQEATKDGSESTKIQHGI